MAIDLGAVVGNILRRVPIERFLFPPRDETKALQEFLESLEPSKHQNVATSEPKSGVSQPLVIPPETESQETLGTPLSPPGLSTEQTLGYQNREIGKLLLRMERHCVQKFRVMGEACDCGQTKHLLDLESLCEETIPMAAAPDIYYQIISVGRELGPRCTVEVVASGQYDDEFPVYSKKYRDFRKSLIGSLEPSALFPQKGEPEGTRILPVLSDEDKEKVRDIAHQKIEQVLGPKEE